MKVALSWLGDYVDLSDITPEQFAAGMTMSGSMVEGIENLGAELVNVVTGRITEIHKHENADSLQVCMLDIGGETLQIVTGATNVKVGQIVPVAKHGAKLAGGVHIKKGKLRGVESNGMLCSHEELGLSAADLGYEPEYGILILDENTSIGIDIREVFGLNENVADFDITSNRPDCQSVIGLAREAAVTFGREFRVPEPKAEGTGGNVADEVRVDVTDRAYCPRYSARMVKNVKIGPSPAWMARRLEASGIRSINNIVDITNYVLLEYGQPMHAFDMRDLDGAHIVVRRAADDEEITTLDDVQRKLDSSMLVIADENKAVAVAGVMGAQNSEVKDDTATVLFESANFDGASVRVTAKKLGLRTEASSKYEKGIDPYLTEAAVHRACELVELLGCGEVVGGIVDVCGELPQRVSLPLRPDKINAFLGAQIETNFMIDTLRALDFEVDEAAMTVMPPTYRADVESEADLAEEIVRIYGYHNIESTLMAGAVTAGGKNEKQRMEDRIKRTLVSQGMYEILTYTFTNPNIFDKLRFAPDSDKRNVVRILNPLGEENSVMRTTTLASMLEILARNFNQRNASARLFEIAKIYTPTEGQPLPEETDCVTLGMYGGVDYYDLKGTVEALLGALGIDDAVFAPVADHPSFHPGRCASLSIGDRTAGYIGQMHPAVAEAFGMETECYLGELSFGVLKESANLVCSYRKLPRFPAVSRDLALLVDKAVLAGDIARIIKKSAGKMLDSMKLFDVYEGAQIPAGKKSMAYSVTLRAEDKTLTEEEIGRVMGKVLKNLEREVGAQLR